MVTNLRSAAGMAAIWVFAVVGVSATAWVAIDRAGRDITVATVSTLPPAALNTPTLGGVPTRAPARPQPKLKATPKTVATPTPTAVPSPVPTSAPVQDHRHYPDQPAAGPTDTGSPPPATAPTPVDRTTSVPGGLVSARCTGDAIRLLTAQPDNNWRVHVDTSNGQQIVVSFLQGDEDSQSRIQVTGVCTNGAPRFTTTSG